MARKPDIAMLRQLASIRALQKSAAEADAMRSAAAAREKADTRGAMERKRDSTAEAWDDSVGAGALYAQIAPLWANKLIEDERAVKRASQDAQDAATRRDQAAAAWQAAMTRADVAAKCMNQGLKRLLRKREEDALQHATDRHLHRDHLQRGRTT